MDNYKTIVVIGIIEVLIGSITLFSNYLLVALSLNAKSPNVLYFVVLTAILSTLIGIGILKLHRWAYDLLLYFSSVIILSKILMFFNIFELNGQLEVSVHKALNIPFTEVWKNFMNGFKNFLSIFYHTAVIYYLKRKDIKEIFYR